MSGPRAPRSLVEIPGGRVRLVDEGTRVSWLADVEPFRLAVVPVTVELWGAVSGGDDAPSDAQVRLPVVDVSWIDALELCNALSRREGLNPCYALLESGDDATWDEDADGYRLPTEAEWELACRAGCNDDTYGPLDEIAWYAATAGGARHAVGEKASNAFGLYDIGAPAQRAFHVTVPDGVFDAEGSFRSLASPTDDDVRHLLERVARRVSRALESEMAETAVSNGGAVADHAPIVATSRRSAPPGSKRGPLAGSSAPAQ